MPIMKTVSNIACVHHLLKPNQPQLNTNLNDGMLVSLISSSMVSTVLGC
jgi:hypothetical protein